MIFQHEQNKLNKYLHLQDGARITVNYFHENITDIPSAMKLLNRDRFQLENSLFFAHQPQINKNLNADLLKSSTRRSIIP